MIKIRKFKSGSSLLETLIYAAIFAVVVILVVNSLLAMSKSYGSIRAAQSVNFSASAAMERMVREIRFAESIDDAGSVFGSSPGRLKLNTGEIGLPAMIQFFADNGAAAVVEEVSTPEYLTSSSTELVFLRFDKISVSTSSQAVRIRMTLRSLGGKIQRTENFYNTATLRGSY